MLIEVLRLSTTPESTIGALYVDGAWTAWTVEDTWRADKEAGVTRIPQGRYRVLLRREGGMHADYQRKYGDIHRGMLWLQDVPQFSYVYFHVGNKASHSEGCILVGKTANSNTLEDGFVGASGDTYRAFYPAVADNIEAGFPVYVRVRDFG